MEELNEYKLIAKYMGHDKPLDYKNSWEDLRPVLEKLFLEGSDEYFEVTCFKAIRNPNVKDAYSEAVRQIKQLNY